jgi:signal transduction histidine kinase/HPt (histidine-containing phosphotransfer) domain-containing protein/ActR/RegA family two-component response regulator
MLIIIDISLKILYNYLICILGVFALGIFNLFKKKRNSENQTDEISALRAELAEVKAQAENANRVKNAFFASVSHEIRTPMNAVLGVSEMLLEDAVTTDQQNQIEIIRTHSNVLLGIIDDLLDFSRIENGSFSLQPGHYYFPALLEEAANIARLAAREKGLEFISEIPHTQNLPQYLYGDAPKLSRALVNLLSNAVKYTEKGKVTLSLSISHDVLKFAVVDTGIGIKPEDCERLFKVFGKTKSTNIGLGLGLTITDNIICLMEGTLSAESIYGFGSTFKFEIPYIPGDEKQVERNADEVFVIAPEAKVLIVDDIDVNLTVGIGFLKQHGINPDTAASANEAIKQVCEKDYDIILMDYMMPEIDGGRASEIIRSFGGKYAKTDKAEGLRIIALTASVTHEAKELMLKSGMDDFLPKPVTKQALNRMLLKWLPPHKCEIESIKNFPEIEADDFPLFVKAAEKIKGLNIKLGFKRSGAEPEAYEKSLKLLCRRVPKSLEKLQKNLTADDKCKFRDFTVEAHGMKGALAICGFEELSELAYELELLAESENAIGCQKKLPPFKEKLLALKTALDETFVECAEELTITEEPGKGKKQGDNAILESFVKNIIVDIERFDRAMALEEIENAQEYAFDEKGDKLFKLLKADLEDYDYDSAMEKLQSFNTGGNKK